MPNFTSPGQEVRYQGSDAQIICGECVPPEVGRPIVLRGLTVAREVGDPSTYGTSGVSGPAGTFRVFALQTLRVDRWKVQANDTAEAGANAGSNLEFCACSDAGVELDKPVVIVRAAGGLITIGGAGRPITLQLPNQGLRLDNQVTGAGASLGTLTNAPVPGNPTFWLPLNIAGTVRYGPLW